jgi:CYTH domain-containing protein
MKKLEIERKFLVKLPNSWSELAELFDKVVDIKRIIQFYLKAKSDNLSPRVRKTVQGLSGDTETVYHINKKKPTSDAAVHEEEEAEISEKEYNELVKQSHPDKKSVEKTRFVFKFKDQMFELDVFKDHLEGLAILELELDRKDEKIKLPPFLHIVKEVTKNDKYSNFNLADKDFKLNQ